MRILGIDPGASTGLAVWMDGKLESLRTVEPWDLPEVIHGYASQQNGGLVVFEDSRLQTRTWTARGKASMGAALATARSLGQVDAWCALIDAECKRAGIKCVGVSPREKGGKLDATLFAGLTGWQGRCNQHERDAALVAFNYRGKNAHRD